MIRKLIPFLPPILLLTGCVRTIYIPHGTPVRLRETVEDVKVWVKARLAARGGGAWAKVVNNGARSRYSDARPAAGLWRGAGTHG